MAVPKLRTGPIPERAPLAEREEALRERLLASNGLCADDALFYRDAIAPTVARCCVGLGLSPAELEDFTRRFEAGPDLTLERAVGEGPGRFDLLSTRAVKSKEAAIVEVAVAKATTAAPAPSAAAVQAAIAASPVHLDDDQVRAVEAACSPTGWCTWNGWAGTGKTSALRAVVSAYRGAGGTPAVADQVLAVSTAAMTAQETARKIGADGGYTVEGLVAKADKAGLGLTNSSVVIVDEYVMLDTFRAAELVRVAGDAQVICVGDPLQLQGIGASGWQADVEDALAPLGHGAVTLTNVHRQEQAADREMLAAERTGQAAEALHSLSERGRLHVSATPEQADGEVLATYRRLRDEGRGVKDLFVNTDTSNARVDTYNRLIQDDRLARGEISGAHLDYRCSDANANRHETLYVGDRVALVASVEDRGRRVANGRKGTIVRIDEDHRRAVVALDDGKAVRVDVAVSAPVVPLRLCYAGHACRLQGAEAPVVLVVPGDATTSLESAYSSLSRGQEEIHVFADTTTHGPDPVTHLAKRWAHPEPKRSATARAHELAAEMTAPGPELGQARLGEEPMTGRQGRYLAQLGAGGEEASGLTRREASARITELQQQSGRPVPAWARKLADELGSLGTIDEECRSPAPPPAREPAPAMAARSPSGRSQTGIGDRILAPPPPCFEPPTPNFEPAPAQLRPPPPNFEPVVDVEREFALERRPRPPRHQPPVEGN